MQVIWLNPALMLQKDSIQIHNIYPTYTQSIVCLSLHPTYII